MVQEPSHVKQLAPIHVRKIGLKLIIVLIYSIFRDFVYSDKLFT
jgi:hypothetical protein